MDLTTDRVCIAPGDGIVARHGAAVLFIDSSQAEQDDLVDELLSRADAYAGDPRGLVRAIAAVVTAAEAHLVPPLAVLAQDGDRLIALACGNGRIVATEGESVQTVSGEDATTYVERLLPRTVGDVWLTSAGAPPDRRSSLTSGVVRGGGARITAGDHATAAQPAAARSVEAPSAPEPTPPPEPAAPPEPPAAPAPPPFEPIDLTPAASPEPEPPADDAAAPAAVMVQGIYCSRSHFNSPAAIFCSMCGISMVQQTHNLLPGPRPPLGVLVTDTGDVFVLNHDYVLGREPDHAPEVVSGSSRALTLDDPELAMSRIHAKLVLDGWEVRVEDAGSANGTFLAVGGTEWSRLEPGLPVTIVPGARIRLGARTLTFETHQRV